MEKLTILATRINQDFLSEFYASFLLLSKNDKVYLEDIRTDVQWCSIDEFGNIDVIVPNKDAEDYLRDIWESVI